MECQICLEAVDSQGDKPATLVTKLCSDQCPAHICSGCLARHVEVTLERFYAGLLPKVRCPICLTFMASDRWQPMVASQSNAAARFEKLCQQACALRPPCCHKMEYTHLPAFNPSERPHLTGETEPEGVIEKSYKQFLRLHKTHPDTLASFLARLDRYCGHDAQADSAVALADAFVDMFATQMGPNRKPEVVNKMTNKGFLRILSIIRDSERRATLLLAFLFKRPVTHTLCCNAVLCFNCKRAVNHTDCNSASFDEDTAVVQCRSCRATLLKVDGCDSVVCLCGFSMSWLEELQHKRNYVRGLYAVSIFDAQFDNWTTWSIRLQNVLSINPLDNIVRKRALRLVLKRPTVGARICSRMTAAIRRWKFRRGQRIVGEHLDRAPSTKRQRLREVEEFLAKVGDLLGAVSADHIAWQRWKLRIAQMQSELFWACYWREHQQEMADASREQDALLRLFCKL